MHIELSVKEIPKAKRKSKKRVYIRSETIENGLSKNEDNNESKDTTMKSTIAKVKETDPPIITMKRFNWFSEFPVQSNSIDRLNAIGSSGEQEQARHKKTSSFVISNNGRQLIAMPYLDIGLPEFLDQNDLHT